MFLLRPLPSVWFSMCLLALGGCAARVNDLCAQDCLAASRHDFGAVLECYTRAHAAQPLEYQTLPSRHFAGVEQRRFSLQSQSWSPQDLVRRRTRPLKLSAEHQRHGIRGYAWGHPPTRIGARTCFV